MTMSFVNDLCMDRCKPLTQSLIEMILIYGERENDTSSILQLLSLKSTCLKESLCVCVCDICVCAHVWVCCVVHVICEVCVYAMCVVNVSVKCVCMYVECVRHLCVHMCVYMASV